jgi:hypothetical protein
VHLAVGGVMKGIGLCEEFWSPIVAASPESALAGVLAGFVFTAITVVLTTSPSRDDEAKEKPVQRSYALQLFASSFIIFALDSYFTSVTAGELACSRAYAESALAGGILGDGAILMIAGLGWLIVTYSGPVRGIETILSYINWGVWAVIVVMLAISPVDVGDALLPGRSHTVVNTVPWVLGAGMAALVIVIALHSSQMNNRDVSRWVRYAAVSGLGAAIFAGLFTGIASAFGAGWWINPPVVATYVIVILSILVPAVPLFSSIPTAMAARAAALTSVNHDKEEANGFG